MASFKLDQPITLLDGTAIVSDGDSVTYKDIIVNSLLATGEEEIKMEGKKRLELYELAKYVHAEEEDGTDLSTEEIELIKKRVEKSAVTLVYGRICELLKV